MTTKRTAKQIDFVISNPVKVGLPIFSFTSDKDRPNEARLHYGHYCRMEAVVAAAKSKNPLLLELALSHYDEKGRGE